MTKQEVQEFVQEYVEDNPVPELEEDIMWNKNHILEKDHDTKEGREMLTMMKSHIEWYNPLGEKMAEFMKSKGLEQGTPEWIEGNNMLVDEQDKLIGFKIKRFDK